MRRANGRRETGSRRRPRRPRSIPTLLDSGLVTLFDDRRTHTGLGPVLSGGDLDADWRGAESTGEEAVGGSVATPDQDVVDEIGRALGVEQDADAEFHTTWEILSSRDRHYWHLERVAVEDDAA